MKDDRDNQAVDTQDTSHDNGYDGLEDEVGLQHTHAGDTNTTLGGSVGGSQVCNRLTILFLLEKTKATAIPMYPKKKQVSR